MVVEHVDVVRHPDAHGEGGDVDDVSEDLEEAVDEPEAAEGEEADHDAAGWEEDAECHGRTDCVCENLRLDTNWWSKAEAICAAALSVWVAIAAVGVWAGATWWSTELCGCKRCWIVCQ